MPWPCSQEFGDDQTSQTNPHGFLNRGREPASLDYLNNRYHDPVTAQFISVDPLVTSTGEPYIYGAANPTSYSDPSGLDPQCFGQHGANCTWTNHDGTTTATQRTQGDSHVTVTHSRNGATTYEAIHNYDVVGESIGETRIRIGPGAGGRPTSITRQRVNNTYITPEQEADAARQLKIIGGAFASAYGVGLAYQVLTRLPGLTGRGDEVTGPMEVLRDLQPGRSRPHRLVDDVDELDEVFDQLSRGGTQTTPGAPGSIRYELPNGGTVQMRPASRSGGATVDYVTPEGVTIKVHVLLP